MKNDFGINKMFFYKEKNNEATTILCDDTRYRLMCKQSAAIILSPVTLFTRRTTAKHKHDVEW